MHSFLVVGLNLNEVDKIIEQKIKEIGLIRLDFELTKIEDARELSKLIKLKNKGVFVIRNIDKATIPALNAFLKNLEDPGEDIHFILTTTNLQRVLPTIVSRSEVIYTKNQKVKIDNEKEIISFLKSTDTDKIKFVWSIKDRDSALNFISNLIVYTHNNLDRSKDPIYAALILEVAEVARRSIEAYGQYKLHLLNFIVQIKRG